VPDIPHMEQLVGPLSGGCTEGGFHVSGRLPVEIK